MQERFWEHKKLADFTEDEWEAVCMNCGKCCLLKLEDEDSGEIFYTNVVCRYFDRNNCRCTCYRERCTLVPTCLKLTKENVDKISWMPQTCAYRYLAEGKGLPAWHPLLNNGRIPDEYTIKNYCVPETDVKEDELEDHIIGDENEQ